MFTVLLSAMSSLVQLGQLCKAFSDGSVLSELVEFSAHTDFQSWLGRSPDFRHKTTEL